MKHPDVNIDKAIIRILCKEGTCGYRELKRRVDAEVKKERTMKGKSGNVPSETFFRHLMRLVRNNSVRRQEGSGTSRTSKVNYSITSKIDCSEYG